MRKEYKHSEETKKKISESHRGKKCPWLIGNKHSLGKKHSMEHKKKMSKLMTGRIHSEKSKRKMSKSLIQHWVGREKRNFHTEEFKKKLSKRNKGNKWGLGHRHSEATKRKIREANTGRDIGEEWKRKISENHADVSGENNPNWQGGIKSEPYSADFNQGLKLKIKKRDNFQCQECYYTFPVQKLNIHHIDYDKKNSSENNLITLCKSCHGQTNFGRKEWESYFKNKIYA